MSDWQLEKLLSDYTGMEPLRPQMFYKEPTEAVPMATAGYVMIWIISDMDESEHDAMVKDVGVANTVPLGAGPDEHYDRITEDVLPVLLASLKMVHPETDEVVDLQTEFPEAFYSSLRKVLRGLFSPDSGNLFEEGSDKQIDLQLQIFIFHPYAESVDDFFDKEKLVITNMTDAIIKPNIHVAIRHSEYPNGTHHLTEEEFTELELAGVLYEQNHMTKP